MSGFALEPMARDHAGNGPFLASIFLLAGMGLATLWSASVGFALSLNQPADYFFTHQLKAYIPGIAAFVFLSLYPLEKIRAKVIPITIIGLAVLLLPFVPGLSHTRNSGTRWILIGKTTLQPSEIWKPISVLYLSHILDNRRRNGPDGNPLNAGISISDCILPFCLTGLGCVIIYLQVDFSTAVICALVALGLFWAAGAPPKFFLGTLAVALPLGVLSVLTAKYRLERVLAFLVPDYAPQGKSYQILASLRAIRSGGFWGKGIGLGTLKLGSIPEVQSDFIFAAWTEEMGYLGVLVFFALWGLLAWFAYRRAYAETDPFKSLLGFGLITLLILQVLINAAVVCGMVPATGIPLPFFSAAGSSVVATSCTCGLLVNLSRKEPGSRTSGASANNADSGMDAAFGSMGREADHV